MIAIAFASPPASPAIALVGSPAPRVTERWPRTPLEGSPLETALPSAHTRCAHIHNLVLIWREQPLAFGEGGRDHPLTLDPAPHIDEAILLGVVDKRLLVREFPLRHPPSAALLVVSLPGKRGSCVLRPSDRPFTPPRSRNHSTGNQAQLCPSPSRNTTISRREGSILA